MQMQSLQGQDRSGGVIPGAEVDFLHEIGSFIIGARPRQDVLLQVMELVSGVVGCDSCLFYEVEDGDLVLRASKHSVPGTVNRARLSIGRDKADWLAEWQPARGVVAGADPRGQFLRRLMGDPLEELQLVPVLSHQGLVGVISLQYRAPRVSLEREMEREVKFLSTIGFLIGAEIERMRLEDRNAKLREQLETRKILERAKGILQRDLELSEEQAYLALQKQSRQKRKSMREIGEAIILNEEIIRSQGRS